MDGLRYKPREGNSTNGNITRYEILVSDDGVNFRSVTTGSWEGNASWKMAAFSGVQAKFVRLVALAAMTDNSYVFASAAEIRLTGKKFQAHAHAFGEGTTVTEATCTDKGLEERKCECGEVETREIEALGHDYVNGKCQRCDAVLESDFEDVAAGAFYFDPVKWAVDNKITAGTTPTTFDPIGKCMRAVVVTFLWKAAGFPEP